MSASWENFQRLKTRGLDARRAGNFAAARVYLLKASAAMLQLAGADEPAASGAPLGDDALRKARRETAEKLLHLARDCESRRQGGSAAPPPARSSERENEAGATDWVVSEKPRVRFSDVAGLDDVKQMIRLRAVYPFTHPELAEKFDLTGGGGVLLYGPPGTGKTMLARATAGEVDATFFRVSAAELLSKWVGEAEQNVARLFAAAAAEPRAVVFIDEVEALLPARRDDGSGVMQRVVAQILQGIGGFDGPRGRTVFLAATNHPWQLDPAVLRPGRFDEKVYVSLPDLPARSRLIEIHLRNRPLTDDVDTEALAARTDGYSGADIEYICDKAAMIPFLRAVNDGEESAISMENMLSVIESTAPSVSAELLRRFDEWRATTGSPES